VAAIAQWAIARAATPAAGERRVIEISDGAVRHNVPLDEIESVAAAGNYVEIDWRGRSLLHRATLAGVENDLAGQGFVRIHRSRLVRRAAIRRVETRQSGDFEVELDSGVRLKGSRRYRAGL
jgi:DNA-binding LytR/AlgR family response regulator